jgi:hypothetical protein
MQPGRLPGGEPDKPDIDPKKSPAHRPQAPTWSVEPGIGTTIIADVQSASARQRSSCRRGIAATSAPEATQARGCDGLTGRYVRRLRQVTCFAATPWPETIRTASWPSLPIANQEAAKPGIAAPSTGSAQSRGAEAARKAAPRGVNAPAKPPAPPRRFCLTVGRRLCSSGRLLIGFSLEERPFAQFSNSS